MTATGIFDYCNKLLYPYGCVDINGTNIELQQLSIAVPGDIVEIDLVSKTVITIKKNNISQIAGMLFCTGPIMGIIKPGVVYRKFITDNSNFPEVLVSCRKPQSSPNEYGIVTIIKASGNVLYGNYMNKIGTPGNLLDEREYFMYSHNIKRKKYPKKFNIEPYEYDITPDRTNMTELYTISIDPSGCEDIDDALSIVEDTSCYQISVHIADVSSFIPIGSDLDKIGSIRTESLYLNWMQEDMYPKTLVEQMSLFKNQNKRSFTITISLDKITLEIVKTKCEKSIVNLNENLTYETFQKIYKNNGNMNLLYIIGKKLYDDGNVVRDTLTEYDSHKMVEIYMVLCNSVVAQTINSIGKYLPISRSHKEVDIPDILNLAIDDENINSIIRRYKLSKAKYIFGVESHDSIGQELYSHFTSPIRRYADLMTHRLLYYSIFNSPTILNTDSFNETLLFINKMQSYIQKGNRESILLDKLYDYHSVGKNLIDTVGTVVAIGENNVVIFCESCGLETKCPLYSHKISHLLTIELTNTSIKMTHNVTKNTLFLSIGNEVELKIVITFLSPQLKNKITGQLLNPNPMILFDFSIYDDIA